ncbi:electron transporter RnfD [candidate division KSB3 bacterium]|uniref:Ion-translocating oxidoreductase complex subunit D n=1 Tax=candidate division KSB3 bacterium TaxID=2044937 RepID=A0A2G6E5R1_9BACT|nr:MAG: electron transporter RnfD [candidate division KSB3 bacterium]PIE29923.1 MAG: electron transporter RnfD [candidate division KSB3 bacterium]
MEEHVFVISSAPHVESTDSIPQIMYTVVLALIPAMAASVIFFGVRALVLLVTCVASCVLTEYVFQRVRQKPVTLSDWSAVITGILLALVLPPGLSLFSAALGSIVAIAIGKQVFGGLGYNIFNPALVGRAFLQATFPVDMTTWVAPFSYAAGPDAVSAATPLGLMKMEGQTTAVIKLFIGNVGGSLGEASALAVLIGGGYLLYKKYIEWRTPAAYLGTVFVLGTLFWLIDGSKYPNPFFHLTAGGLMLGAFFMATDMVTSPVTPVGCWVFGIGAGLLVIVIRLFGGVPEGVMFSILLMNAVTPLINRYTKPKVFGERMRAKS